MTPARFAEITSRYKNLRLAVAGDFCLDRYLEIDPARTEISVETGLAVHNVTRVRSQPGAAGTILNNLVALGIGELLPIGMCGADGEGFELRRALQALPGVKLDGFVESAERVTFTYCKPLVLHIGQPPQELNRLDTKNWTPTSTALSTQLAAHLQTAAAQADGLIVMDQVDVAETGVITAVVRTAAHAARTAKPGLIVLADSRRGLGNYPPLGFKMNAAELAVLTETKPPLTREDVQRYAVELAVRNQQPVFVTLSERGIVGATAAGAVEYVPSLPLRGPIDIVGAGDSVTANLMAALTAGATQREAMEIAMAAASLVVHQLGTTGTASVAEIGELLFASAR